ncbi:conserved hypothetical protein [Talaromyces stipitatus ATCC 10500]|uniref:Mediator of RNA polymerase II transcription subunit 1 n=1 Tax=Talaromyces stipitatus (strain ATCC 10500 / CBS 375.48 / QM 6759 / NRRL 1006) TaxID=441959 RepID=B8M9G3_TALSN|nr:uncharacterized protein TSTA_115220 [Talaromyces stipitatus ATCC 10500]EED17723.1 conserved hypothetical protein [Talaromyces stipitatus ATCC 10500]
MATPSSRPNPGATPTHLTSSPHPSAVPMGRGLSHKSPSMKTPSASGTAHGHHLSTSSHQGATPLTAIAGLDDPVSLSSPSALLALGGFTGMSPALNVQDGLVGPGMHDSDIRALTLGLGGARNHEEERRKRIEEVVQLLRGRVAGRGVSREAVERLGRLEGFESIWQEDSLSIAGNSVDLEIEFYPGEDNVKDVSLSYASLEGESESERREEATIVLKGDLIQTAEERENRAWKSLKGFQSNLERLAKLDHLSQEINCFEAVESLFESLQKVWDAESRRGSYHSVYEHLCRGSIGRPSLHRRGRVGMGLEYWVEGHRILHAKQTKKSADPMAIDTEEDDDGYLQDQLRSVTIECEEGFPSLRISKEWVGAEILSTVETNDASTAVNWMDPPPTLQSSVSELDTDMVGSGTANRRFVAKLEPHIHVPLLIANDIYRHLGLTIPHDYRTTTYDGLLVPGWTSSGMNSNDSMASESLEMPEKRRMKAVLSFDEKDEPVQKNHSYSFQAFEAAPGMTIREFPFSHPRQLADIFPIFRQYSLLATLMQKVFPRKEIVAGSVHESKGSSKTSETLSMSGNSTSTTEQISILSNGDPNEDFLNNLLAESTISLHTESQAGDDLSDVRVDITLRTQIGQAPLIMLSITVPETKQKASVSFEIRLNGRVNIAQVSGLGGSKDEQSMAKIHRKLNRVLEVSEDLSVLVEYVVSQLRGMS